MDKWTTIGLTKKVHERLNNIKENEQLKSYGKTVDFLIEFYVENIYNEAQLSLENKTLELLELEDIKDEYNLKPSKHLEEEDIKIE